MVGLTTTLIAALQVSSPSTAAPVRGTPEPAVFRGRAGELAVDAPKLDRADIDLDGRLTEPEWAQAAVLSDFTQYEPIENIPSTEATEVRVFYTADAIYFGIQAFDREPDEILARLGERDRAVFGDDWVRIMLDTFNDQRQAYIFYVNPLGLQTDGFWIEGLERGRGRGRGGGGSRVSIDFNPDFIWESGGRVDRQGWTAELRIPYVSLRFRSVPMQDWGINIAREVKRRGFKQSWAPLTQNVSSTLAQSGRLVGLHGLHPRRLVEVNPVVTGTRDGTRTDGTFSRASFNPDYGVNGRIGLTRNLVLDATVNPDFSQVEADDNRITVNERFALFFPEKRSFFLEGMEIFRTPRNLVHTRRIADPSGGAKLTGKVGSFNVGYLGAVDEGPTTLFGGNDRAVFNLVRARRDLGRNSTIGLLYTDRTLTGGGGANRVVSGDARLLFGRFTLTTQFAGSWTSDGSSPSGPMQPLFFLQLSRTGRAFSWSAKFDDVDPGFDTRSGFIPRVGDTETFGNVRFTHFGRPGSVLERVSFEVRGDAFFDHDEFWSGGTPFEGEVEAQSTWSFRGGRSLTVLLRDGYFRFRPEEYATYEILDGTNQPAPFAIPPALKHMKAVAVFPRLRVTNALQVNGRLFYREIPIFREADRGLELQVGPDITLRPTSAIQLSLSHTYSRIWRRRDRTQFSSVNISRLRAQYQFTRALFARAIVQYDLEEQSALRDPTTGRPILVSGSPVDGVNRGDFQGQFLVSYEPSPGTIFFIGYNRLMSGERTYRLSRLEATADRLFVKLSYLFRM